MLTSIARLGHQRGVPKARVNLTRYHGVFAPNSKHRARITPAKRGKGSTAKEDANAHARTPAEQHVAMTWAQRLKRVFGIDMQICASNALHDLGSLSRPLDVTARALWGCRTNRGCRRISAGYFKQDLIRFRSIT